MAYGETMMHTCMPSLVGKELNVSLKEQRIALRSMQFFLCVLIVSDWLFSEHINLWMGCRGE